MKPSVLKEGSKLPVFLSALVFPGLGQFLQRRWGAGCFFLLGFLTSFGIFCIFVIILLINYYEIGFDFDTYEGGELHFRGLIVSFIISILLYLANIVDTALAQFRARKSQPSEITDFTEEADD